MKMRTIIVSLWLITQVSFASEQETCPSGCGRIEHVFSKNIAKRYAEEHPNSGLDINIDNENVPTNIVNAAIAFGLHTRLTDNNGNPIIPQRFGDGENMVLPMYKSKDFTLRKSIVATTSIDDVSSTKDILRKWRFQYTQSISLLKTYQAGNIPTTQEDIIICPPCTLKERKE